MSDIDSYKIVCVHRFQSLPALCSCVTAACGASATSEKHAMEVWSMHLADLYFVNDFRVQQMLRLVAATRNEG